MTASGSDHTGFFGRLAEGLKRWRNTSFSTLDHMLTLVLWAASTPIFINVLGKDLFGVWILINSLIGLGGVISFGFGEATIRYVAHYRGLDAPETARKVVETSTLLYVATTMIFTLGIWWGAVWITRSVFDLTGDLAEQAIIALRVAAIALLVTSFLKTWEAAINGYERFDVTARINMIARSLIIIMNVILALAGFGLPFLLTTTACALTGQALVLFWMVRRDFLPGLRIIARPDPEVTGEILRFGLQSWLQICAGALANVVDRFLVGALVGPAAAGVYAVCLQLGQQIFLLLYRGLAFMMPASSRDVAEGVNIPAIKASYDKGTFLTLGIISAIGLPLYVFADHVLIVWVGPEFAREGGALLRYLVLYFGVTSATVPAFFLVNGSGYPAWNTVATLSHGLLVVAIAYATLPSMGLDGIALARILAAPTLFLAFYTLHVKVMGGQGLKQSLRLVTKVVAVFLLAIVLQRTLGPLVPARLIPAFAAATGLALVGATIAVLPLIIMRLKGAQSTPPA